MRQPTNTKLHRRMVIARTPAGLPRTYRLVRPRSRAEIALASIRRLLS